MKSLVISLGVIISDDMELDMTVLRYLSSISSVRPRDTPFLCSYRSLRVCRRT